MTRFLITAANSDIAIGMARILRNTFPASTLIGVAPDGPWPGSHFFDHVHPIPFVSDVCEYTKVLESLLNHYEIDVLCPISEKELFFFSQNHYNPAKKLLINQANVLENFLDKYKTYEWLKERGLNPPETFLMSDIKAKSLDKSIIKPRASAGSKNMHIVDNNILFDAILYTYKDSLNDFVAQRSIGTNDQEYTCALWRFDNDFRNIILHRKLQGGLTGEACVSTDKAIQAMLEKIAAYIEGDFFINVQLRLENDCPYVFEINSRFSSTIMMRHKIGFQDVYWSFLSLLNEKVPSYNPPSAGTKLFRTANEVIIPYEKL